MPKEIVLSGDVGWEITASKIRAELATAKGKDVVLLVNSPGGFVSESLEISNLIQAYKGKIEARITGIAASAASYMILAADKVSAHENAVFMIHNAWNFAIGDHNDMRKTADVLESLSNISAKAYAKKTGKDIELIKNLMDNDTFFFGDEIKAEGFVDEIIEAPEDGDDDDKAAIIVKARASMDICLSRMRESEAANEDFNKAVAYVDSMSLLGAPTATVTDKNKIETPAVAGNIKQEDKHMDLKALLAENPSAKAELDVLIATARTEGKTEAKDEMKTVMDRVAPILGSPDYSEAVKTCGVKAITGEGTVAAFEAVVVMADESLEKAKAELAKKETEADLETPGATAGADAEAQANYEAKLKRTTAGG